MTANNSKILRTGFTTGTCVAACAKAAYLMLENKIKHLKIDLLFPDQKIRSLQMKEIVQNNNEKSTASIVKDAGSDPDITNGILIKCSLARFKDESKKDSRDYVLKVNNSSLIIRGERGVGTVTRNGIAPLQGKWAINPVPIKMITENLSNSGFGKTAYSISRTFILKIILERGKQLSEKTLNPLLGVEGGLSVLGTTGIVVPYSHSAYIETIRILINALDKNNIRHVVLTTGAQSLNAAAEVYPELPKDAFIRIADYIADSLKIISDRKIKKVTVACMPGKLFKYACSFENTNAKYTAIDTGMILKLADQNNLRFDKEDITLIENAVTIREVVNSLSPGRKKEVLNLWKELALKFFRRIIGTSDIQLEILVFDYKY